MKIILLIICGIACVSSAYSNAGSGISKIPSRELSNFEKYVDTHLDEIIKNPSNFIKKDSVHDPIVALIRDRYHGEQYLRILEKIVKEFNPGKPYNWLLIKNLVLFRDEMHPKSGFILTNIRQSRVRDMCKSLQIKLNSSLLKNVPGQFKDRAQRVLHSFFVENSYQSPFNNVLDEGMPGLSERLDKRGFALEFVVPEKGDLEEQSSLFEQLGKKWEAFYQRASDARTENDLKATVPLLEKFVEELEKVWNLPAPETDKEQRTAGQRAYQSFMRYLLPVWNEHVQFTVLARSKSDAFKMDENHPWLQALQKVQDVLSKHSYLREEAAFIISDGMYKEAE